MILDVLVGLLDATFGALVRALPKSSIESSLPDTDPLRVMLSSWDAVIPFVGPLRLLSGIVAAFGAFLVLRVALWLWSILPGKAS